MYEKICKRVYLPFIDFKKRLPYKAVFDEATRNQFLPGEALKGIQLRKLNSVLAHAANRTRFYKDRLKHLPSCGLESVAQLRSYPLLSKRDLYDAGDAIFAEAMGRRFDGSTSGSTGISMRFQYDSLQKAWSEACQWRGRSWHGVNRWDPQVTLWARPVARSHMHSRLRGMKFRLRNSVQFDTFDDFDESHMRHIWSRIEDLKPKLIYGYGSSIGRLAAYAHSNGFAISEGQTRLVEFTADHMFGSERNMVMEVFRTPARSAYGASETPGVAQECPRGNGHISVDNVVVEFLRPDGTEASPGEMAEIVITTLNNYAMPLIRYRVGDFGSYKAGKCECGITLPMMELSIGKAVDIVQTSACSGVSAHLFDYINLALMRDGIRGIRQFFVAQTGQDDFVLSVVAGEGDPVSASARYVALMAEKLGQKIRVQIEYVPEIPSSPSGKRRYFKRMY